MSLEELVEKFISLATKSSLAKSEQEVARQLMQQLKGAGMTNEQISKLSKGKWTSSTIKFYTPGIKPTHPTPWDDTVSLLDKLIATGFSLDDIETAVIIAEDLKSKSVSLDNVISLLLEVDSSPLEVADLIHQYELLNEHGLPPKKVSEVLSLKEELEKIGLQLGSMTSLVELAKNYGDPDKIIEALSHHKSIVDLDEKIAEGKEKLNGLNQQLTGTQEQIGLAEADLSKRSDLITHYENVKKLGFGVNELTKLSALAQKHGSVTKLMDTVDAFNTYSEILDKLNKAKSDLATSKSNMQELQTKNAHLKTAVTMCQTLINKYAFGLDAVVTVFSIADKYGAVLDVLKAVEAYGKLEALNQEIAQKKGEASQLKEDIAQLEGQHKQAQESLDSLSSLAAEVGNQVGKVEGMAAGHNQLRKLLELFGDPNAADYEEYIGTAIVLVLSLKRWVVKNQMKFKYFNQIKSGLENLFRELGGLE